MFWVGGGKGLEDARVGDSRGLLLGTMLHSCAPVGSLREGMDRKYAIAARHSASMEGRP